MDTRTLLVALSNLVFAGVCGTVGVRLLRLARRTRQAPELCIGLGLVGLIVSIPLITWAGIGRLDVGEVRMGAAGLALIVLTVASAFVYAFTWKAFRPGETWAAWLVAACSLGTAAVSIGTYLSLASAPSEMSSFEASFDWIAALYYPMLVSFAWTAIEGFREWTRARRRLRIGIGDEVVANRFLLWGLVGGVSAVNGVLGIYLHETGHAVTGDPLAASISSTGGVAAATLLWLMFIPPASYLRWIRGDQVAEGAGAGA